MRRSTTSPIPVSYTHLGVAFAVVIVDVEMVDEGVGLDDDVDGFGSAFRGLDGGFENVVGEDVAVDSEDLVSGSEAALDVYKRQVLRPSQAR